MSITLTNPNNRPVVTGESLSAGTGVSVDIDYTTFYDRIATAVETMATNSTAIKTAVETMATNSTTLATNSTTMATNSTTMATNSTTIAANTTAIAALHLEIKNILELIRSYQEVIKGLAVGSGIHVISPYETFSISTLWKLLILEGKILEEYNTDKLVSASEQQRALEYMQQLSAIIKSQIPKDF